MDLTIRLASEKDEPLVALFAGRLVEFELPPWRRPDDIVTADAAEMMAAVRAGASDNEVFIAERAGAAERAGTAVGCLHILADTDFFGTRHAHVSVIATSVDAEGSGVGRALLGHAEAWARQRDLSLLTLNVFASNARARRFYENAGWSAEIMKYAKPI